MAKRSKRRAFGKIRTLPSGRYQASYVGPDLVRHKAKGTFEAKMDAEAWIASERRLIERDVWVAPSVREQVAKERGVTLAEYAPKAIRKRTNRQGDPLRPRTLHLYDGLLERVILPELGHIPLRDISSVDVGEWYAGLDIEQKTQRAHAYALLKSLFEQAQVEQLVRHQPCNIRGAGSTKRARRITPATVDELRVIVANMPPSLQAAALLAAWCGLRFGEVAELRRRDIDLRAGTVSIQRALNRVDGRDVVGPPKSDAGRRVIAMPSHLIPALEKHLAEHVGASQNALLFTRDRKANTHWTQGAFYKRWMPAREAAGRTDLRFHDLRHTQAVLAAQTGATLAELMARLGHSTPQAAMRYQTVAAGRDALIAAKLAELAQAAEVGRNAVEVPGLEEEETKLLAELLGKMGQSDVS